MRRCITTVVILRVSGGARFETNLMYRLPPKGTIPTHNPEGVAIDADLFLRQVQDAVHEFLKTPLIDHAHEMKSLGYFDCCMATDVFVGMKEGALVMPKLGREHRSSEMSETIRYLRGLGMSSDVGKVLQETNEALAQGGDFLVHPAGATMGVDGERTNLAAEHVLLRTPPYSSFFNSIQLKPRSPPLTDLLSCCGMNMLVSRGDEYGDDASSKFLARNRSIAWIGVRLGPKSNFATFTGGTTESLDIMIDAEDEDAMDTCGRHGLIVHPIEWTEPRKLGITFRRMFLVVNFNRAGVGSQAGAALRSARAVEGKRQRGAPLPSDSSFSEDNPDKWVQKQHYMKSDAKLPDPVYQPIPRYRPPMHQGTLISPSQSNKE